jgi:hypothetical protein
MDLQDPVRAIGRLDDHLKSVRVARQAALDIAAERELERHRPRRVYDSGWYRHEPGDPLPDIESFMISSSSEPPSSHDHRSAVTGNGIGAAALDKGRDAGSRAAYLGGTKGHDSDRERS